MNSIEAYSILEVLQTASKDEIKKAFRKKAAKAHPDVGGSELEFKKINEAYQLLQKPPATHTYTRSNNNFKNIHFGTPFHFNDLSEILRGNFNVKRNNKVKATVLISFEESILGCSKSVSFDYSKACNKCGATGQQFVISKDNCEKCEGKGFRTYQDNQKILPCTNCKNTGRKLNYNICKSCNGSLTTIENKILKVNIPGGIIDGMKVRLPGQGDQVVGFHNHFLDAIMLVNVIPDPEMRLSDLNVISDIQISLLQALQGGVQTVKTVKGERVLKIPPKIKNNVKLRIPGLGVLNRGDHFFIIEIMYPDDEKIEKVIETLKDDTSMDVEEVSEPKEGNSKKDDTSMDVEEASEPKEGNSNAI